MSRSILVSFLICFLFCTTPVSNSGPLLVKVAAHEAIKNVLRKRPGVLEDRTLAEQLDLSEGDRRELEIPEDLSIPEDAMRPIAPEKAPVAPIQLYPDNATLTNPFGSGVELASQGLMQWLAPRSGGRWHSGLDLVPAKGRADGAKLYAPGDGFILRRRDWHPAWGSYLIAVFRKGQKLYLTGYFHLRRRSHHVVEERDMEKGVTGAVTQGQFIGRVGRTGAARGAHLHIDVVEIQDIRPPDLLSRLLWSGRTWSEIVHPGQVIEGLPVATYHNRQRPDSGLIVRRPRCGHSHES